MSSVVENVVEALCNTLFRVSTIFSLLLERALSQLHSTIHGTLESLSTKKNRIVERAWWDTKKGSAVVIWCPGDQTIPEALAISLASIRAKSGLKRAGRPPYTVLIILSSGLPSIISSWANRKAKIEDGRDNERGRRSGSLWEFLTSYDLSIRLASPDSAHEVLSEENDRDKQQQQQQSGDQDPPSPTGKMRKLSFGNWSASDVVGFGKDMLKGIRIGQAESKGIGAVIPVFADTSTPEGITHAQSTIKAYCTSHNLLLRALIVVPSLMGYAFQPTLPDVPITSANPTDVPSIGSGSGDLQNKKDVKPEFKSAILPDALVRRTHVALTKDVSETMNVLSSLLPFLKADGGRVVAIVPTLWRKTPFPLTPRAIFDNEDIEFKVTRRALMEMWSGLSKTLARDNISISQVHMASSVRPSIVQKSVKGTSPKAKAGKSLSIFASLRASTLERIHYMLYPIPRPSHQISLHHNDIEEEEDDVAAACPQLLLDSIRSVLIRSWPRGHYCVGLGPRLEILWSNIPGHDWIQ